MIALPPVALASALLAPAARATATTDPSPSTDPTSSPTTDVTQTVEAAKETAVNVWEITWRVGGGLLIGVALAFIGVVVLRMLGRRQTMYAEISRYTRTALYAMGGLFGAYLGAQLAVVAVATPDWAQYATQALFISVILAVTWVVVGLVKALEASIVSGVRAGGDPGRANRVTTQAQILRRVAEAIVIVCGLVGAIMTFPSARLAMSSLLASAGLVSVIAGLAAQSMLGNIFAGLQLAVTDAIRVDDVVVLGKEQGYIEEITLTYVVVRVWDDRRLIYPSTYFTQNPFANWSRRGTQHTGTLTLDLDWRVPVASVRAELARVVASSSVWDGRTANLDVTDTAAGTVTLRIAVSGRNPSDVFTLQCYVREEIVAWLQQEAPYALPRTRVEIAQVSVTHDPQPEEVARLAEELVALQHDDGAGVGAETTAVRLPKEDDPIEDARVRAAAKGHSRLRRTRREKVRRRRILARDAEWRGEEAPLPRHEADTATGQSTSIISTNEQKKYLE